MKVLFVDQSREILSGRFEIAVTTIAKYVTEDITILKELDSFGSYFSGKQIQTHFISVS